MKELKLWQKICIILGCLLLLISVIMIYKENELQKQIESMENYQIYLEEQIKKEGK